MDLIARLCLVILVLIRLDGNSGENNLTSKFTSITFFPLFKQCRERCLISTKNKTKTYCKKKIVGIIKK